MQKLYSTLVFLAVTLTAMAQGWPADYKGVMLQGFYWDSFKDTRWPRLEEQASDLEGTFDLVWIPQSGKSATAPSMGYDPLYWFTDYSSSFGLEEQLRSLIKTFKEKGIGTIADVVINHRGTLTTWNDFPSETYNGVTYAMTYEDICSDDEAGRNGYGVGANKDTGEAWDGMRDLDHVRENVQTCVKAYLDFLLNDLGYAGFRYDMVKGYAPEYTKRYNESARPRFSVGECWDGTSTIRKWIDGTGKNSAAFDFQFRYTVRNAINSNDWSLLGKQNEGNWPLVSKDYESGNYRRYAVTFVENHDTERRSNAAQDPIKKDTLAANAYLLAMPGTPCVFLTHWKAYKQEIKAMVQARKLAGISNTSSYSNLRSSKDYFANVVKNGDENRLLVIVGSNTGGYEPSAGEWQEVLNGYKYRYFLPKSLNTPFTDKVSGTFSEPFDVKLTSVTDHAGARLVYTTDGSDPSDTNGTEAASGTTLRIKDTTVLKVALIEGSTILSVLTNTYTCQEPETVAIPAFCTVGENEVCAFFEAPEAWDKDVYCWAWSNSPAENFTSASGTWPGIACEKIGTTDEGNSVWKWTWDGTKQNHSSATQPAMIIFSNQGAPQTADLDFANGGYYNEDGLVGIVNGMTGIQAVGADGDRTAVYSLDGRLLRRNGDTSGLPKGIYIVGNKKVILI